jgi:hypothetical protein
LQYTESLDQSIVGEDNGAADQFGDVLSIAVMPGIVHNALIVGMPYKDDGVSNSGMVQILGYNGVWSGTVYHSPWFSPYSSTQSSEFGHSIAIGDFNHDGVRDLAVGAPNQPVTGAVHSGAIWAYRGESSGISFQNLHRYLSYEIIRAD